MPCSYDKKTNSIQASGDVGDTYGDGFGREDFVAALAEAGGSDVVVHLDSMGGDVFQGQSIYNQLRNYDGSATVVVDSIAASIASILMCGGDEVLANSNSTIMIHNPYTIAIGDAKEFRHTADVLDKLTRDSAEIYAEKTGKKVGYWLEKMDVETWFSAAEALEEGLIDGIVQEIDKKKAAAAGRWVVSQVSVSAKPPRLSIAEARANFRRIVLDSLDL